MSKENKGNWFARHKVLTVILAIIVLGIAASALSGGEDGAVVGDNSNSTSGEQASKASAEKTSFGVGELISFNDKEVTVSEVERGWNSGNQFIVPDSGQEYVKVQVSIKNNSSSTISYNSFDWKLKNSNGVIKDVDGAVFTVDGALNSGELASGGNVAGFLVFQAPAGDAGLTLQYSPMFWSSKQLDIKI